MLLTTEELERGRWVAEQLLKNQSPKNPFVWWGEIYEYDKKPDAEQKRVANAFLLACLLDYRRRVENDDSWGAVDKFL